MMRFSALRQNRFLRFLFTGGLNTLATYVLYLALKLVIAYQVAYFVSYVCGIVFAYFLSTLFVFEKPVSLRTFVRFPLVYVVQYGLGAVLLAFFVETLGLSPSVSPLLVIILTLPVSFLLSRSILKR
ncbi:GtrA family protein [Herbaspirillum huttiense F1]|nr:GtrA family protein [Herbaspirillum huttiense]MBN9359131.1 GtrA family protein [Herbaspirillum huttiense]MDT0355416.1 GtrA family protein [Herbaspirillum huttiense F1]